MEDFYSILHFFAIWNLQKLGCADYIGFRYCREYQFFTRLGPRWEVCMRSCRLLVSLSMLGMLLERRKTIQPMWLAPLLLLSLPPLLSKFHIQRYTQCNTNRLRRGHSEHAPLLLPIRPQLSTTLSTFLERNIDVIVVGPCEEAEDLVSDITLQMTILTQMTFANFCNPRIVIVPVTTKILKKHQIEDVFPVWGNTPPAPQRGYVCKFKLRVNPRITLPTLIWGK